MLVALISVSLLVVVLGVCLYFSMRLNISLSEFAARFEENYEKAQDSLSDLHDKLNEVLSHPVVVDDPVTRRVLANIKACRIEVVRVARLISMQKDSDAPEDGNE